MRIGQRIQKLCHFFVILIDHIFNFPRLSVKVEKMTHDYHKNDHNF